MDVELRIGRAFAAEADDAAIEPEIAAGEIVIATHQVGPSGEARCIGKAADAKVRPPAAADAKAVHPEVRARDLEVEPPRMQVLGVDHILLLDPAMADLELRYRRRGSMAERELAVV